MDELKRMIEAIGKAFEEFKAANDLRIKEIENGRHDPVLAEKVDRINAELTAMANVKKQLEALETAVAQGSFPGGGSSAVDVAKKAHKAAFDKWFRKGVEGDLKDLQIQANLSTLSDPDGGFLVPEETEATIDRIASAVSVMRRICTVRTIGTDEYKKLVSKGVSDAGWVEEKGSRDETDTPTLVEIAINTKELYSNPAITQKMLDDARLDIAAWLGDEVSVDFDEQEGEAFIGGNGVGQPKGIGSYTMIANSSYAWGKVGFTAGGHATLLNNSDKLIDLQHSLKSRYRNGASWLMNDLTCSAIRKLKDGEGNYLWKPGLAEGVPDSLLGKPIEYDDNVADIGAGKFPVWFANFKRAYMIIDRFGIRVLRDPYTNKPYVHFYTTKRVGGGVVMYEAIKALKISA
ncbi:MAG: phage major capsid protein [Syntrophorhabdaceae bacterium]